MTDSETYLLIPKTSPTFTLGGDELVKAKDGPICYPLDGPWRLQIRREASQGSRGRQGLVQPSYVYLPAIPGGKEIREKTGVDFSVPTELGESTVIVNKDVGLVVVVGLLLLLLVLVRNTEEGEPEARGRMWISSVASSPPQAPPEGRRRQKEGGKQWLRVASSRPGLARRCRAAIDILGDIADEEKELLKVAVEGLKVFYKSRSKSWGSPWARSTTCRGRVLVVAVEGWKEGACGPRRRILLVLALVWEGVEKGDGQMYCHRLGVRILLSEGICPCSSPARKKEMSKEMSQAWGAVVNGIEVKAGSAGALALLVLLLLVRLVLVAEHVVLCLPDRVQGGVLGSLEGPAVAVAVAGWE
ncbi:hypothetical protein B0T24DRAFT_725255 [Lasiosphaeria ovina]|uniref:Uncharacterized protein n=1 Tax=Lasiosphaeria ovina TaxID=92902 RepID=A0AAE0JS58_9PEZI|nr:hypothetical protein B0T24DRAFT_725255 [Lasiosphaeria ovina]